MKDSLIKVKKLAYVRIGAPDLEKAERFLDEFGLLVASRTDHEIYFRGTDAEPPCYILSKGAWNVTAIGFEADSVEDLEKVAQQEGASAIESIEDAYGGKRVCLNDPVGMHVEIVFGRTALPALEPAPSHFFNMNGQRERLGELPAIKHGSSRVKRIGHLVLESANPELLYNWYHERFGLTRSDAVHLPNGSAQMIFSRLDRGQEYVDHHVVGFQFAMDEGNRVQHIAFEVGNLDDLMSGHEHLKRRKHKNVWGIGRHLLGGQIFDYWKSPFGLIHEHWTDTDLINETHVPKSCDIATMKDYWGPAPTPGFFIARWNFNVIKNVLRLLKARLQSKAT